ncbi:hypothetical protein Taro_052122, partial [Colocasia esculenta]|nr:hypothetical protein [Colocasia esculenta]
MLRDENEGMFTIPGFSQIQFEGFCRFINQGLMEEFDKFPKIEDTNQEIEFQLFMETYQLAEHFIKERDAVYESLTYSSELYVLAGLIWKTDRDMKEQTVFIGNIPLMNSLGTFIVNRIYGIVINQILQSPGIYYRSKLDHNGMSVYTSTIISDWGGRSELEIDRKARIWARVSRKQKISILVLSSAMGLNLKEILDNVGIRYFLSPCVRNYKKKNQQRCELGRIGRRNINQRLNLDIPQNNTFLLPRDVLAAADHLIGMKFGMGTLDDMNHLKNKRIRSVADRLQDQFGLALVRLENAVRGTISGEIRHKLIPTPQILVTSTSLTTTYESFFGLHPLSQVLDRTNPLTQIVHGRKLSYLGPGGVTGRTASFHIRDIHPSQYGHIHPSQYGRICPIDTSEGINVGLIGSLAIHVRIGHWGSIESPFYEISERSKEKEVQMVYLSPSRDEYYMVAVGSSLALNRGIKEEQVVPARYRQEFLTIAWEQHNDANRALMSSNMQRQAVPLSRSEKCIVGTGLECQAALDSRPNTKERSVLLKLTKLFSQLCINVPTKILVCTKNLVFRGGQILADGAATVGGELALGKNVLVDYMPWEGYNFEDAVLISERLVYSEIYTSFHIRKYEIQTHMTSQEPERITNEIPHLEAHLLRNLDRNGIVMLGSWVETCDILVSTVKETSLKLPTGGRGRLIDVRWIQKKGGGSNYHPEMIRVYISQKREIKVGDKVAGRHGNKGIISKNLPRQDMLYLQDGIPIDMVFNPLGVPSRMNVGQIFKCSLGLAGDLLNRYYRIVPFDERYEQEASRKLVFLELYEASKQTKNPWVFEPEYPGKSKIFDGRTGDPFEQPVLTGKSYILKLIHQVDDKIHGRSSGHYALVTQQPLRGVPNRGDNEWEKWKDLVLLIFYKKCLLINLIILELIRKYLVQRLLEEQYLILKMLQNLFDCLFENYDLWLWNRIIS